MNKRASYFQYNWIKYLLIILIPILLWSIIYSDIDKVQDDESVKIFYIGEYLDTEKLQEDILSNLPSITTQQLQSISIMTYYGSKDKVYDYLRNKIYSVDIVIISEEVLNTDLIGQIFSPFTLKLKQDFLGADFINVAENTYGITAHTNSVIHKYYSKSEKVSVFLSQHSLNIGKAYGYGKVENDSAIQIAKYISGVK